MLFAPITLNRSELILFCTLNGATSIQIENEEKFLEVEAKAKEYLRRVDFNVPFVSSISFWTGMR